MKSAGEVVMDIWTEGAGTTEDGKGYILPSVIEKMIESRDAEHAAALAASEERCRELEERNIVLAEKLIWVERLLLKTSKECERAYLKSESKDIAEAWLRTATNMATVADNIRAALEGK